MQEPICKVVIVGGGTAGWMTAASLANFLDLSGCDVTLVESDQIGTIGVGEATLPHIRHFNQTLGIDEREFMRATNATYKIGIEFSNWGSLDSAYIHPFGDYGFPIEGIEFHHFYNALRLKGFDRSISDFSLPVIAASKGRFEYPSSNKESILSTFSYAFHLDATLYARYLRGYSEKRGVKRVEGKVVRVEQAVDGSIAELKLADGKVIAGDLFVDCSGLRALLIGDTLKTKFDNWNCWLPCDRAVAVPSSGSPDPLPYTKAIAHGAGWQWRIPLQHRTGNGHVYCSSYISDEEAENVLLSNLEGEATSDAFKLKFEVGHRRQNWNKNCVAIGLSAGFLEPLESTSIHLIQTAITKLLELFPTKNFEPSLRAEFNRVMDAKFASVRDFLILHYHATARTDTEFWNYCRTMAIPDELQHKMDIFRARGHISYNEGDLFLEPSWVAVYFGQELTPKGVDPRVGAYPQDKVRNYMLSLADSIEKAVGSMPSHTHSLAEYANEGSEKLWPKAKANLYGR